jgi:hypothetical protein
VNFWHPWDPWGRVNNGKKFFRVQTATVKQGVGRPVNPISIRGDTLCSPHYYVPSRIFRPCDGPGRTLYDKWFQISDLFFLFHCSLASNAKGNVAKSNIPLLYLFEISSNFFRLGISNLKRPKWQLKKDVPFFPRMLKIGCFVQLP